MICKLITITLRIVAVALLLFALLFADGFLELSPSLIGSTLKEITAIFRDSETQWMVFLCLGIYFMAFLSISPHATPVFWRVANPNLWLVYALFISAAFYAIDYSSSTQSLTLLGGAVLSQEIAVWVGFEARWRKTKGSISFKVLVISLLVILLALASVWSVNSSNSYEYYNHARWSGPWINPNIFGLLMATGISLAFGLSVQSLKSKVKGQKAEARNWKLGAEEYAVIIFCLLAAILMIRGLLHSYSRGAWVATFCGIYYLIGFRLWVLDAEKSDAIAEGGKREAETLSSLCLKNNWLPAGVILFSVVFLSFWHFRHAEWYPARRAFSSVNTIDFSWRNRITAWEGALQIMAEHPWFGVGWNRPEPLYKHYYLSPKLTESAAIEMNDYFMLCATLGIPALFCFGMYLWLSLTKKPEFRIQNSKSLQVDCLQVTCRAGAIVLLVGFWFDGGLFELPTAATFWILLELGTVNLPQKDASS